MKQSPQTILLVFLLVFVNHIYGQISPGGVSTGLELWLRADQGTSCTTNGCSVSSWTDQSANGYTANSSNQPSFSEVSRNYNPAIEFDGNNNHFEIAGGIFPSSGGWNDIMSYSVVKKTNNNGDIEAICSEKLSGGYLRLYGSTTADKVRMDYPTNSQDIRVSFSNVTDETTLWTFGHIHSGTSPIGISSFAQKNGGHVETGDGTANGKVSAGNFYIGSLQSATNKNYDGSIFEQIILSSAPTPAEHIKIQSYLCLKYGLTMDPDADGDGTNGEVMGAHYEGDYLASDGSVIWDYNQSSGYQNQVIGIIRDDDSGLEQKQSVTADDNLQLYVGTLSSSNATNAASITNDASSIVVGHNDGALSSVWSLEVPTNIYSRFERVWRVQNHNFSDTYSLEIEWDEIGAFDIDDIRLLVDDDGDFSDATVFQDGDAGLTITQGSIILSGISTSHIPLNSARFITIGSSDPGTPLPVELLEFNAIANDQMVDVYWSTVSESNVDYFELQRSNDGVHFTIVERLEATGNSTQRNDYKTVDVQPLSGISYYRIKWVDGNGEVEHSNIVPVQYTMENNAMISVFPNPSTRGERASISLENIKGEKILVVVRNVKGEEFYSKVELLESGESKQVLPIDCDLPPGLYLVVASSNNALYSKKLIVK